MKLKPSIFGAKWGQRVASLGLKMATLAGYDAGQPSITRPTHSRYNSNPNSLGAQIERVFSQFNAEYLAKNSPFGIGYLRQRINYCSPQGWLPNTVDSALNKDIRSYCEEQWEDIGINCSLWESFSRTADVEMPVRGDAALLWYRDESRLRLIEVSADQIGELYTFTTPQFNTRDGFTYFAGMLFDQHGARAGMRIYERGFNQCYTYRGDYPASDIIYFSDNLFRGIRGITKFHGTIISLTKSDQLFQYGMDAAQKQAKTAVVINNELGGPLDQLSYETRTDTDGNVIYIEKNFEGAQTEYQYSGDSYQVIKTDAPGPELIEGCRYADERSCLSLGMPYSFLVNARDVGGAPSRLEIGKAGKEINRITRMHERAFKKIAYVTIMDGIDRRAFGNRALQFDCTKGSVQFPTLPTADAFRETMDDINSNRAGIESRQNILGRYREDWHTMLGQNTQEAMDIAKARQDANRELKRTLSPIDGLPYEPTIDVSDIAQNSPNPAQSAQAEGQQTGRGIPPTTNRVTDNPPNVRNGNGARMAALEMATAILDFDSAKHPRGQPENKGEFVPKGQGGSAKTEPSKAKEAKGFDMREDMKAQVKWIESKAKEAGHESVEELVNKDPSHFDKLAKQWRVDHPRTDPPPCDDRCQRAKKAHVMVDAKIQRYAEEHNEPLVAKALGGVSFPNSEPIDIAIAGPDGRVRHGIELKTVVKNSNAKITMKGDAIARKRSWERKNKATVHTVVIDDTDVMDAKGDGQHDESKRKIFYRRGYGSFRIGGMYQVKDMDELKSLLDIPKNKLPEGAK